MVGGEVTAPPAPPAPTLGPREHPPTFLLVEPADEAAVVVGLQQQLFEELPEVDGLAGAG